MAAQRSVAPDEGPPWTPKDSSPTTEHWKSAHGGPLQVNARALGRQAPALQVRTPVLEYAGGPVAEDEANRVGPLRTTSPQPGAAAEEAGQPRHHGA